MKKHTPRRERLARTDTLSLAVKAVAYLPEHEVQIRLSSVSDAVASILEGKGTDSDWCNAASAYNVILVLAHQRGVLVGQATEFCSIVGQTIETVYSRPEDQRLPTEEEAEVFEALVNLFADMLESVPQRVINAAELKAYQRMRSQSGVLVLRH